MRDWVATENLDPLKQWDDYDLLRFCRARKFVLVDIQTMFTNFLAMRKEFDVDNILENF